MVKKLHQGDIVRVLRGKDRDKQGRILAVFPKLDKVLIEGVNIVKKHVKPKQGSKTGQRVSVAMPLPVANVQVVCPECKKSTRVGIRRNADGVERICKKCNAIIPKNHK